MALTDDHALIKDGVVQAVARAPVSPASLTDPEGEVIAFGSAYHVCAGMLWDGETLSNPPPPEPEVVVPASVSMRQARLALLAAGLLAAVQAHIDAADEAVRIEWEYATDIHRNRDLVTGIGSALGLTSEQIDALFIAAAAIP